jgi:hypothetical protein
LLGGSVRVSTLEACRRAENPTARDANEGTLTVTTLPGTNSLNAPELARLLGVDPTVIHVSGKDAVVTSGENAVSRSERIDAFVFCTSANGNDLRMKAKFGAGCVKVRDAFEFFTLIDAHLRRKVAPNELGACVVDDVEYGPRRITYRDHSNKHYAFLKPSGGEKSFEQEAEVRALWILQCSVAIEPEILTIPEVGALLELL